ncbi:MAG: YdcF family protein, partial [Candidatus Parcubacteria bacterium]|nr:YdcF family protein [Candidatus Parcubacteria bacterium]
ILEKYPQIPENAIILEDKAIDTPNNAVGVEKIISNKEHYGIDRYALLTSSTHIDRANRIFQANGLKADLFPAEAYAKERVGVIKGTIPIDISGEIQEDPVEFKSNKHYQRLMERYAHSPRVLMQKVMEGFYQTLITLKVINPRGGGLSEKISKTAREQQ